MKTWQTIIMLIGISFAGTCLALFVSDIAKAIYHQFKGAPYEWYTIKVLKENREWWKWVLAIAVFVMPFYIILTNQPAEQEDFCQEIRYYECNYRVVANESAKGTGIVLVAHKDEKLTAEALFTEHGFVQLGFFVEAIDDNHSFIYGDIKDGGYIEIDIENGPVDPDTLHLSDGKFYYYGEQCEWCGVVLPTEYIYDDGGNKCPTCVYKDYEYMNSVGVWKCGICNDYFDGSKTELSLCPWCSTDK